MKVWKRDEVDKIGAAEEIRIAPLETGGRPRTSVPSGARAPSSDRRRNSTTGIRTAVKRGADQALDDARAISSSIKAS